MSSSGSTATGGAVAVETGGTTSAASGGSPGGSAGATPDEPVTVRSDHPRNTDPAIGAAEYAEFIDGINQFAFDLFHGLAEDDNLLYSPLSTSYALGMTYAGARENTAAEMRAALRVTVSDEELHAGFNQLALELATRPREPEQTNDGEKSVDLELLDEVFAQTGYDIVPGFLDTMAEEYGAGLQLLDFYAAPEPSRGFINDWVAEQTRDRIVDLIPAGVITSVTRLVLVNTLTLNASWEHPFPRESTGDGTFHTLAGNDVAVPMMHGLSIRPYVAGTNYEMVDLPYFGDELFMTIVLPAQGSFDAVRDALSVEWLQQARSGMALTPTTVTLPRFQFTWGDSL